MYATGSRSCGLLTDAEYRIIWKRTLDGHYDVPVADRTLLEKTTLRRYQRYRQFYSAERNPSRLYYKEKEVLSDKKCNHVILSNYQKCKGIGVRRLYKLLKRRYTGISERKIKSVLAKLPDYEKKTAKFPNKAPLKHVCSKTVHEILQIDIVDMQRHAVTHKKKSCKYILSVMDIFSRYVWLKALPNKAAGSVAKHLSIIFREFGEPKVVQHDRGKEFDGKVTQLLKTRNIKNIKSRPYHPQSQGKVERMHRSLKGKIAYDLTRAGPCGINWAKQLPKYQHILNHTPKECLAWNTPYDIYYGRDPHNNGSISNEVRVKKIRDAARAATLKCNRLKDKAYNKICKTPVYDVGDFVLLRYKRNGILNRRKWTVHGKIIKRSIKNNMYKIEFRVPGFGNGCLKVQWYHISDLTKANSISTNRKLHRKKYLIPITSNYRLQNLRQEFGLPIIFNPIGNGNCQFSAVTHLLRNLGIFRSEETLRNEVVEFLRQNQVLGSGQLGDFWSNSLLESPDTYLTRMAREFEYGDHITLQAMSQLYHVQIIVVSTLNSHTTLISPDGSTNISDNIPIITLGHYPENAGEHYVALQNDKEMLNRIISCSSQITWDNNDTDSSHTLSDENLPTCDQKSTEDISTDKQLNDSILSKFRLQIDQLRESRKVNKRHETTKYAVSLPDEIWYMIIKIVLQEDPSSRFNVKCVSRFFKEIVYQIPPPRLYLAPERFSNVPVSPISVRKILKIAGSYSGLVLEVKKIIPYPYWVNAWLFLRLDSFCGWYVIERIWYKRRR